jgi:hypothetical protein
VSLCVMRSGGWFDSCIGLQAFDLHKKALALNDSLQHCFPMGEPPVHF